MLKNAAREHIIAKTGIARTAREMHIYIMGAMLEARLTNSLVAVGKDLEIALLRLSGIGTTPQKTRTKH
jgi:hypothetical protein